MNRKPTSTGPPSSTPSAKRPATEAGPSSAPPKAPAISMPKSILKKTPAAPSAGPAAPTDTKHVVVSAPTKQKPQKNSSHGHDMKHGRFDFEIARDVAPQRMPEPSDAARRLIPEVERRLQDRQQEAMAKEMAKAKLREESGKNKKG